MPSPHSTAYEPPTPRPFHGPDMARRHRPFAAPLLAAAFAATVVAGCGGDGADTLNAGADSAETAWNTPVTIDVLANDEASDGTVSVAAVGKPDHGTAEMVDGRLVYIPEPGWFGVETFSYTARGAGISAPATVKVAVQARMTLTGTVADAPLPQAPVTVAVGAGSFTTTTDADGRYRLAVTADAQSDVVRIEAAGTGAQSAVRLVSYPGTAGAVAAAVDDAGVVDAARSAGLNVSHLSTAVAALLSRGPDGGPTSGAALDLALATVDPDAVAAVATALYLVIDGGEPLPTGMADSWALARDASAVRALRSRLLDSGAWDTASLAALEAAPWGSFKGPGTSPQEVVLYGEGNSGAQHWRLRPGGTGTAAGGDGTRDMTWQVQDGELVVGFPVPWSYDTAEQIDLQSGAYTMVRNEVLSSRVRLMGGRLALSRWQLRQTVLDGPRAGEVLAASLPSAWQLLALTDRLDAWPVAAADLPVGTRWAGPVQRQPEARYDSLHADVMRVTSASQVQLEFAGESRSLAVADGSFTLQDAAGAQWRYTRLRPADAQGLEAWLVQGRIGTPQAWSEVVWMAPLSKVYTPAAADLVQQWAGRLDLDDGARTLLRADGSAVVTGGEGRWALLSSGEVRITRPLGADTERVLQWWPLALADGRLLVLRRVLFLPTGTEPTPELTGSVGYGLQVQQAVAPGG